MAHNEPLSEAQLNQIGRETRRAADKSLAHYSRRALVGFVLLLAGVAGSFWQQRHDAADARRAIVTSGKIVSVAGCNRDFNSIKALRGLLLTADKLSAEQAKAGKIPVEQAKAAHDFYVAQLEHITLPDCREAEAILTDNPSEVKGLPAPLYEKPKPRKK